MDDRKEPYRPCRTCQKHVIYGWLWPNNWWCCRQCYVTWLEGLTRWQRFRHMRTRGSLPGGVAGCP